MASRRSARDKSPGAGADKKDAGASADPPVGPGSARSDHLTMQATSASAGSCAVCRYRWADSSGTADGLPDVGDTQPTGHQY